MKSNLGAIGRFLLFCLHRSSVRLVAFLAMLPKKRRETIQKTVEVVNVDAALSQAKKKDSDDTI